MTRILRIASLANGRLRIGLFLIGLLTSFAFLATGCRTAITRTPDALPASRLIEREQLLIHSDFYLPRRHRLIDELVSRRIDLESALNIQFSDEPINVFLFDDELQFRSFMFARYPELPDRRAFFIKNDTQLNVYAYWGDRVGEDLRHEVTHGYLHSSIPNIPLWLDEGLAEYFEVPRGEGGVNPPHVQLLASKLREGTWQPDLARLEDLAEPAEMGQLEYAEAWLWVHFLLNDSAPSRDLLQTRLVELQQTGTMAPVSSMLPEIMDNAEESLVNYLGGMASR